MVELKKVFFQLPGFGAQARVGVGRYPTLGYWENLRHQRLARGVFGQSLRVSLGNRALHYRHIPRKIVTCANGLLVGGRNGKHGALLVQP